MFGASSSWSCAVAVLYGKAGDEDELTRCYLSCLWLYYNKTNKKL